MPKAKTGKPRGRPKGNSKPRFDRQKLHQTCILLVERLREDQLRDAMRAPQIAVPDGRVDAYLAEARRMLTLAAEYNRDEEIGRTIERWRDFMTRAKDADDRTNEARAIEALTKLLALNETPKPSVSTDTASNDEADAIRRHLIQFELSNKSDTPLYEIVRLAALKILNQGVEIDTLNERVERLTRKQADA